MIILTNRVPLDRFDQSITKVKISRLREVTVQRTLKTNRYLNAMTDEGIMKRMRERLQLRFDARSSIKYKTPKKGDSVILITYVGPQRERGTSALPAEGRIIYNLVRIM